MYVDQDLSTYTYIAESLQRIQLVYGKIKNVFAKGNGAKVYYNWINKLKKKNGNIK